MRSSTCSARSRAIVCGRWSADSVPADYEARVRPEAAVGDLVNVEAMLSGTDDITTSFGRSIDTVDDEWRFRVFLRDRPTTIAELVPMLEHLGLSPVDEHPSVFVGDVGHRLSRRHRRRTWPCATITDEQHAEVQSAFVELMTGDHRTRRPQPAGVVGRPRPPTDRRAAPLQPLSPPGVVPVQRRVRRTGHRSSSRHRPQARRVVRHAVRSEAEQPRRGRRSIRGDPTVS